MTTSEASCKNEKSVFILACFGKSQLFIGAILTNKKMQNVVKVQINIFPV